MKTMQIAIQTIVVLAAFLFVISDTNAQGSSCSAEAKDGSENCSISCPEGVEAKCKSHENTVDCSCEE